MKKVNCERNIDRKLIMCEVLCMEMAIAIFLGLWISGAGLLSYSRVVSDFREVEKELNKKHKKNDNLKN